MTKDKVQKTIVFESDCLVDAINGISNRCDESVFVDQETVVDVKVRIGRKKEGGIVYNTEIVTVNCGIDSLFANA